ncbi:MAG: asparagine synthase (glutamine-hydrolyzing) [Clostridia bacterium]|nr:asparagine synthase (glutamine-hydrolyzing) [Clostridia bacterium]
MCGIAGQVSFTENLLKYKNSYERMSETLKDRGPDQNGEYFSPVASLIHRRLAVVDIKNGTQPMTCEYGGEKYILIYNGELYNTDEIRTKLIEKGERFVGHSDTEVVLKAFVHFGEYAVNLFNGIYAFALWQVNKQELFFARDRMGVKPFFYTETNGGFIFASEIKALLAHENVEPLMDITSLAEIMLVGPGRTPGYGIFKGISELKAGYCGTFSKNGLKIRPYWQLTYKENNDTIEQAIEKVRFLVTDSIKRQLVSDVPVCTFLSGGLDSSIISSVANNHFKENGKILKTFSVDYKDNDKYFKKSKFQPNSDPYFINVMSDYLDCEHHWLVIDTPELVSALFKSVDARDLPGMADVDASMLLLCAEIKKYGTVALSGECADEIFGGYPWYRDKDIRMTDGFPWAQSTKYRFSFLKDEFKEKINADQYVYSKYQYTVAHTDKPVSINPTDSRMLEMMKLNVDWFMQTLLDRKDRMSMYSSLEVRVPFCDHRIVEYLYSLPWSYKDYNSFEKGLLRKSVEGLLPQEVLWRKKSPYPKTHHPEYLKSVKTLLNEIIENPAEPLHMFIKKDKLKELMNTDKAQPWYGQLMTTPQTIAYFIQFNYWLKKYKVKFI